ncbi:MAG: cytidine deaminase [Clostridium sp.]|nr:cytidine deaminase [Clostridium sp.]
MTKEQKKELIREALAARAYSYSPYSQYRVGAALLAKDGRIFKGCNIENAAYTPTNCAERTAVFKAVSEGCRAFAAIAVVGGKEEKPTGDYAYPCGVCRQVLREFVDPAQFLVICARSEEDYEEWTLAELLPESFGPAQLERG